MLGNGEISRAGSIDFIDLAVLMKEQKSKLFRELGPFVEALMLGTEFS